MPQVEILDLAGPLQAFYEANATRARYRVRVCAARDRIESHHGLVLADLDPLPEDAGDALVIVPGMPYARTEKLDRNVVRWVARAARGGAHVASVCTGAFVLGEAGLLDGRRCTTHWSRTSELAQRFPRARVLVDRLFVTEDNITTSAGIASGIDMALAFVEQSEGPVVAAEVAREMVVYLRRDGAQEQSSVYLDHRTHLHPGVHRVQDWDRAQSGRERDARITRRDRRDVAAQPDAHLSSGDRHLGARVRNARARGTGEEPDERSIADDGGGGAPVRVQRGAAVETVRETNRRVIPCVKHGIP